LPPAFINNVSVTVTINSISAIKLNEKPPQGEITFDVGAKLEEKERKSSQANVIFILTVSTKPSIVKFGIEGTATLEGKDAEIEKLLEIDPETKIPKLLDKIYQHAFMTLYLISTAMNTPYPPPDLFHSAKQTPSIEMSTATPNGENIATASEPPPEKENAENQT
jgi:hypothetical protein